MHLANNILVGPGPTAMISDKTGTWQHNLYLDVTCVARPPTATRSWPIPTCSRREPPLRSNAQTVSG